MAVETRPEIALKFLKAFAPEGPWKLSAKVEGVLSFPTQTFGPDSEPAAAKWIEDKNKAGANIYFELQLSDPKMARKKSSKENMRAARVLAVDLDCGPEMVAEVVSRISEGLALGLPAPSQFVASGGGLWLVWVLTEPVEDLVLVENIQKGLQAALGYLPKAPGEKGADSCWNIDRIARLPGTTNIPDAKKRAKGRIEALAKWGVPTRDGKIRHYDLKTFESFAASVPDRSGRAGKAAEAGAFSSPAAVADHPLLDTSGEPFRSCGDIFEDLTDYSLPLRALQLIAGGVGELDEAIRERKKAEGKDDSGSGWVFEVYCAFARARVPGRIALALLLDPDRPIGQYHRQKRKDAAALLRHDFPNAIECVGAEAFWPEGEAQGATEDKTPERPGEATAFFRDKNGVPVSKHQGNIRCALDEMGVRVSHDLFTDRRLIEGLDGFGPWLDDAALNRLFLAVDSRFGILPPVDFFVTVVNDYARQNAYHPVRDYLARVEPTWDGTPRIERWLIDYAGAEDSEFVREVSKLTLVAAARRARIPGSKFDEMLVLEGPQGVGKSSAIEALMPAPQWFSDNFSFTLRDREAIEQLAGRWIIEAPELKGMRKSESETRKAFMSRQTDRGRLAYARTVTEVPRTCIFTGTTNDERYLTDPTGNRRFWPVRVDTFDVGAIRTDRDQLWAEAATLEAKGTPIRLAQRLWHTAAVVQHSRRVEDPWVDLLATALGDLTGKLDPQLAWDIVGVERGRRTQADNERLGAIMKDLGWDRTKLRIEGAPKNCYARGDDAERKSEIRLELRDGRWIGTRELPF